jgi:hypothetical protein
MSSLPDPAERFQLPDRFASLGDPVEGNPFPVDHPLHQVWIEATRKAEEEMCHITSTALMNLTPSPAQDWPATLIIAKFDAWAQRSASVVWPDRAVHHYDQWLVCYANSSLVEVVRRYTSAPADSLDGSLVVDGSLYAPEMVTSSGPAPAREMASDEAAAPKTYAWLSRKRPCGSSVPARWARGPRGRRCPVNPLHRRLKGRCRRGNGRTSTFGS